MINRTNEVIKPLKMTFSISEESNFLCTRILIKNLIDVRFKDAFIYVHGIDENGIAILSGTIRVPHIGQSQTIWSEEGYMNQDLGKIATVEITEIIFDDLMNNHYTIEYDITPKYDCETGELLGEYSVFCLDDNCREVSDDYCDDEELEIETDNYPGSSENFEYNPKLKSYADEEVNTRWEYEDAVIARGGNPFDYLDDIAGGLIGLAAALEKDYNKDK